MDETYPHLSLQREMPINEKRPGTYRPPEAPHDTRGHARGLLKKLSDTKEQVEHDLRGFDNRRLFQFAVHKGFNPDDLHKISEEIEFVSQENDTVVIGFASDAALDQFESRLSTMANGGEPTNKQVLHALQSIAGWSFEDRKGWALKRQGFPNADTFLLDVELWPLEDNNPDRIREKEKFEQWLAEQNIEKKDSVSQPGLILFRVGCNSSQAELLLRHRDIRSVDLPPDFGLERALAGTDIQNISPVPAPDQQASGIVVLDSGITTNHPLLESAVGDAQSFIPGEGAQDENGHGTHVAGLALYSDFERSLKTKEFIPTLHLFSGRILDRDNQNTTGFVENHIEEAVRYFFTKYKCKVFNLSLGDSNKPYLGGHLKGLSLILDTLSRELDILFVVSAGNHQINEHSPDGLDWREQYPHYLINEDWRIIEPAPALNVLTVGSIAYYNLTFNSQRNDLDPAERPIAQSKQPSPFTRNGKSIGGAIKPELVAHGGNWAINTRANHSLLERSAGLGVISTNNKFAEGFPFAVNVGTSMAAPQVAHVAASILNERPEASSHLIRALLCAHASVPNETHDLIKQATQAIIKEKEAINQEKRQIHEKKKAGKDYSEERLQELNARKKQLDDQLNRYHGICGYGQINAQALYRSLESVVTLVAEYGIENKRHHFFEIPIPEEFSSGRRRLREIAIGLAYAPPVRSTRINYRATRIDFRLVAAPDLEQVTTMFNKATNKDNYKNIPELDKALIGQQARSKGTVQADFWQFQRISNNSKLRTNKLFVVVTRNDFPWGETICSTEENYALVISLRDRENGEARLYSQIKTQLRNQTRGRLKYGL